nr:hypothetical protein [Thermococcus sp. M36]
MINIQHESANVEECVKAVVLKSRKLLSPEVGFVSSSKIRLTFGAFMHLSVTVVIDPRVHMNKGVIAEYSSGKNREAATSEVLDKINRLIPQRAEIVDFEIGTYTTPVTRRTYAVGVVVYNAPVRTKPLVEYTIKERRTLLARVLEEFNYNPRVLNISEIARMFGVSRDSIYYDIEQILKEKRKNGSTQ